MSMSTQTSALLAVPQDVLLAFFQKATKALQCCQTTQPLDFAGCRRVLLEQQRDCLEEVVDEHNALNDTDNNDSPMSLDQVQRALETMEQSQQGNNNNNNSNKALFLAMERMNDAARLAFARLVLASECLRTSTSSLNCLPDEEELAKRRRRRQPGEEPLKTSRMTRLELLELCALCRTVVRLENVHQHLLDADQPLWNNHNLAILVQDDSNRNSNNSQDDSTSQRRTVPPVKRVENLQRLLLQAMGYDADMGMKEMARHLQSEQDDVELVQAIRQSTTAMMESLLVGGDDSDSTTTRHQHNSYRSSGQDNLPSDLEEGGVTRIVSVQHSETVIDVDTTNNDAQNRGGGGRQQVRTMGTAAAPVQQSMHDTEENSQEQWDMARQAAALRESLAQELNAMNSRDRDDLLQRAEQALYDFQEQAMQRPAGPERVDFLRSMDAGTQKLLAMHRIWQEEQKQKQQQHR